MTAESTEVAVRGPGDPLTRPPWADPYFLDNMDYSAYFEVTGSTNEDRPSCDAYIRAKPFEATQLLQSLYNQRRPRGTNYALWLLTQSLADYFKYGISEDPAYHMSEHIYNELVLGPGHLTELCLFMVALDDRTVFFEEHPVPRQPCPRKHDSDDAVLLCARYGSMASSISSMASSHYTIFATRTLWPKKSIVRL